MRAEEKVQERMSGGEKEEKRQEGEKEKPERVLGWELKEEPSLGISKPELCGSWGDVRQLSGLM